MPTVLDRPTAQPPGILDDPPFEVTPVSAPRVRRHWWRFRFPWIKTAVGAPMHDDKLLIDNRTSESWRLHLGYHDMGIVDSYHQRLVVTGKGGILSARQVHAVIGTAYLTLPITPRVRVVEIRQDDRYAIPSYDLRPSMSGL